LHQNAALFFGFDFGPRALDPMQKYQCVVCGYIYDEALGAPEDGIPAGTKWDDVPDTWLCPDCGVGKSDFEMVEI
jgi:rubredoxin